MNVFRVRVNALSLALFASMAVVSSKVMANDTVDATETSLASAVASEVESAAATTTPPVAQETPMVSESEITEQESSTPSLPTIGYVPDRTTSRVRSVTKPADRAAVSADLAYIEADKAETNGSLQAALEHLEKALTATPTHHRAQLAHGRVLVKVDRYDDAIKSLKPLTRSRPGDWRVWFWLGTGQLLAGALNDAEQSLDEALSRNGEVAEIWLHRAVVAEEKGEWRTALQLLKIANEIAPDHPSILLNLAMTGEALGFIDFAQQGYARFLTSTGNDAKHTAPPHALKAAKFAVLNHLSETSLADDALTIESLSN